MTRRRATFFCAASHKDVANAENAGAFFDQKKVAKEKAARLPLMSCAPRTCAQWGICWGTAEWASYPLCPWVLRAIPDKYCGARRGKRENGALLRNVSWY